MLHTLDPVRDPSAPIAPAGASAPRCLLVAEHGAAWPALADAWRDRTAQLSILVQHAAEPEPAFVRRLCAVIARAQLEGQAFERAALVVGEELGSHAEPARARLLQLLAQSLLRAARSIVLQVHCPAGASAALCRSLERIQRVVGREFRDTAQLILCVGTPDADAAPVRAVG